MSRDDHADHRDHADAANGIAMTSIDREKSWKLPPDMGRPPRRKVRRIEPTALVRFVDAEILFEGAAVRAVSQQLHELIQQEGPTHLVVSFAGVRYVSSETPRCSAKFA